jgi:hypothetical protein
VYLKGATMMYQDKLVAVVKCGGRILRERDIRSGDATVLIPFGDEYSIEMQNLYTERAVVSITIDGVDVLCGRKIILDPNKRFELERFLDDLSAGNRFKFIQKTAQIIEARGDKLDDGFIRIEWQYEKPRYASVTGREEQRKNFVRQADPNEWEKQEAARANQRLATPTVAWFASAGAMGVLGSQGSNGAQGAQGPSGCNGSVNTTGALNGNIAFSAMKPDSFSAVSASFDAVSVGAASTRTCFFADSAAPLLEEGITVKGSVSTQKFTETFTQELDGQKHVIILRLKGVAGEKKVEKPVVISTKLKCEICGRVSGGSNAYCPGCGTALSVKIGA